MAGLRPARQVRTERPLALQGGADGGAHFARTQDANGLHGHARLLDLDYAIVDARLHDAGDDRMRRTGCRETLSPGRFGDQRGVVAPPGLEPGRMV